MAQLGNLLVKGSSRFLNKAYFEDVYICGNVSTGGNLDITANEGKSILSLNRKRALEVYDNWLNINESGDFASGIYCGNRILRTDGEFQVGTNGNKFKVNTSYLSSCVPSTFSAQATFNSGATFNGGLIASSANISEEICNTLIVKDELRSAKWNIDNITNLGSTFYVSPCIVFTNPSVYVNSISGTTVVLTITDNSITSSTIGGATWTNGSKVKLMGRIGNSALGTINGVLKRDLNSSTAKTAYISLDFPNTDLIKFSAGATYSGSNVGDLKMMMYEVNKNVNGTVKNRPIGILLSSYGENKKPCIDIYNGDIEDGSPVARMGYLNGLPSVNGVSPTGYGFYAAGNAYFSGTLVSSSGKIGGFSVSEYTFFGGSGNDAIGICSTPGQEQAIWSGSTDSYSAPFRVAHNGTLYASNAIIKGNITATSGKIGGCDISNGKLVVPSANISGKLNASQIQIGDFTNYSDLTVDTYKRYGFTLVPDGNNNPWFQCTPNRDITINPVEYDTYKCKGGETFKIEFEVSSTVKAANADGHGSNAYVDINVGLYGKDTEGNSVWYIPYGATSDAAGTVKTVSTQITLGTNVRSFSVFIQCAGFGQFSGTLKIRNISVRRMADEALIVNGSITADKITTNNISGTNGWINLRSGLFDYGNGKLKWDGTSLSIAGNGKFAGEITATSGKIGKYRISSDYLITGSGSTCTGMGGGKAFWAGSDDSSKAPFRVGYNGKLWASNATISGVINSTDGSIGGWKVSSNKLLAFKNGTYYDSFYKETYDAEYSITLLSGKNEVPTITTSCEYYPNDDDWKYETIISPTEITCREGYVAPDSNGVEVRNSTVYSSNGITFSNGVKIDGLTKVLWEGADYMNGSQTALLDGKVSDQLNGIVLVWSRYNTNTHQASDSDVHTQFISKWCVGEMNGAGHTFVDPYRHFDKYFYVYNDKIVGNDVNGKPGTEGGLSYDNRNCVLRAVLGV